MRMIHPQLVMKNILIIRPDMIGDCMLITPAIALLRKKYPSAKITVLGKPYTKDIFLNNPHVDFFIDDWFSEKRVKSIGDFWKYVQFIKKQKYDCSIHFYNELPYAALAFFAGIKNRIGDTSKPLLTPFYNKRSNQKWNCLPLHEVEHNILLLKPFGIELTENPPPLQIKVPQDEAARLRFGDFVVGIHIGTGSGNKAWLPERYAKVIDHLSERIGAKVVLTGSSKELHAAKAMIRLCKNKPIDLVAKTTVPELIAAISNFSIFISVDTGPLHIAAALKIPTVAIFPTKFVKPSEWGPWQTENVIVRKAIKCSQKCLPKACPFDDCLKEITDIDVIEAVKTLIEKRGNKTLKQSKNDWLKKSINIFTNKEEAIRELTIAGYNAVEIGIANNPQFLASQMLKEDINVIHWISHTKPLALPIAKFIASPSLPIPPLLIFEKSRRDFSVDSLIELYKRRFNER